MSKLPLTPDFDYWPCDHRITSVTNEKNSIKVVWSNGRSCDYYKLFLRENSPDEETLHPLSRETILTPVDFPKDLEILSAGVKDSGVLEIVWSPNGHVSSFHPGWLYANGWYGEEKSECSKVLWDGSSLKEPPTFDGPDAITDNRVMLEWLEALRDYGVARLENLPEEDGLLEKVVQKIGSIRETNFGRMYTLAIKNDPDSNAYTHVPLPHHIGLPTGECPPGLQLR